MRRGRAGAWVLALAAAFQGCSSQERERAPAFDDDHIETPGDSGIERDADDGRDRDDEPHRLVITDIEESSCEIVESELVEIYGEKEIPPLHRLARARDRFLAEGLWDSGFVLFDENGNNASPELVTTGTLDRVVVSPRAILVASLDNEGVKARAFDHAGEPLSEAMRISDDEADKLAIGLSGESALALWSTETRVAARSFTDSSKGETTFELESGVFKDNFHAAIADAGSSRFAIAWSDRRAADSHHRIFFARASSEGVLGPPRMIAGSLEPKRVVALETTESGYALVIEQGGHPVVISLSSLGEPEGFAYRFLGMSHAHALAVSDDGEMLLAGLRMDGRDVLRRLEPNGAPKGEPLCLEELSSGGEHVVSLLAEPGGYRVLFRSAASEQLFFTLAPPKGESAAESPEVAEEPGITSTPGSERSSRSRPHPG